MLHVLIFDILNEIRLHNGSLAPLYEEKPMNAADGSNVKTGRVDLSVCLIVRNEEADIHDCILSIKEIADEIVVVDTGSADKTVEIAGAIGARVFSEKWENDFSKARNQCLSRATGRWVLFIDADERLTAESLEPLRAILSTEPDRPVVYAVKFLNMTDTGAVNSLHCAPRLFTRLPQISFRERLHEQIWDSEREAVIDYSIREDIVLEHYGYRKSIFKARNKTGRNESILLDMIRENPESWYPRYNYGRQIVTPESSDERCREALEHLEKAIVLAGSSGDFYARSSIYYYMANAHLNLREPEKAVGLLMKALDMNDRGCDIYFTLGKAYADLKQWDKALEFFRESMKGDQIDRLSQLRAHPTDIFQWMAPLESGTIYALHLRDKEKAAGYFETAESHSASTPFIAVRLFNVSLQCDDPQKAESHLYALRVLHPEFDECLPEHELFEYHLERGGMEDAVAFARRYMDKMQKNSSALFLRLCGDSLMKRENYEEALRVYSFASDISDVKNEDLYIAQGHCCLKMNRPEEGIRRLEAGRQALPGNYAIDNVMAAIYMETGEFEKARCCASEALRKNPGYPEAVFNMAKIEYNLKHFREAVSHLGKLISEKQFYIEALYLSGVIYCELGEHQRSIEILSRVIDSEPGHLDAYRWLIRSFRATGNESVAESLEKGLAAIAGMAPGSPMPASSAGMADEGNSN